MKITKIKIITIIAITLLTLNVSAFIVSAEDELNVCVSEDMAINAIETGNLPMMASENLYESIVDDILVDISNNKIFVQTNITHNYETKKVEFEGDFYYSCLQENGYDAYCARLEDKDGEYEVLYCAIKNDTNNYKYILNKALEDKKTFVMYLRDKSSNIYIVEKDLDDIEVKGNLSSTIKAPSYVDFLWVGKLVPRTISEQPRIEEYSLRDGIVYTQTYSMESDYYGQTMVEYANGKIWGQIGDVPSSGNASVTTSLKLEESTYIGGNYYQSISNFSIAGNSSNPIQATIALGYNTYGQNSSWDGSFYQGTSFTPDISISLGYGVGSLNASYNLSITPGYFTDVFNSAGSTKISGYAKNLVLKIPTNKNITLEEDGNRINFQGTIATGNSNLAQNETTSTKFAWSFNIRYLYEYQSQERQQKNIGPEIYYISNAS